MEAEALPFGRKVKIRLPASGQLQPRRKQRIFRRGGGLATSGEKGRCHGEQAVGLCGDSTMTEVRDALKPHLATLQAAAGPWSQRPNTPVPSRHAVRRPSCTSWRVLWSGLRRCLSQGLKPLFPRADPASSGSSHRQLSSSLVNRLQAFSSIATVQDNFQPFVSQRRSATLSCIVLKSRGSTLLPCVCLFVRLFVCLFLFVCIL